MPVGTILPPGIQRHSVDAPLQGFYIKYTPRCLIANVIMCNNRPVLSSDVLHRVEEDYIADVSDKHRIKYLR